MVVAVDSVGREGGERRRVKGREEEEGEGREREGKQRERGGRGRGVRARGRGREKVGFPSYCHLTVHVHYILV